MAFVGRTECPVKSNLTGHLAILTWILTGDWLLSQALTYMHVHIMCITQKHIPSHTEQLLELHRGQGKDIYWRDNHLCPTEEEYFTMVKQSTSVIVYIYICS